MDRIISRIIWLAQNISEARADLRAGGFFHPLRRHLKLKLFKYEQELQILSALIRTEEQ